MKPKSSYDIGDINDYFTLQEHFRCGNYEYETIKSIEDIHRAYKVGKKIVFTERRSLIPIWIGILFSMIGFIIGSVFVFILDIINYSEAAAGIAKIMFVTMSNAFFSAFGVPCTIYGLIKYIRAP